MSCCQITDQLLQSVVCSEIADSESSIPGAISMLLRCVQSVVFGSKPDVENSNNSSNNASNAATNGGETAPYAVVIALCVLLHRSVIVYSDFLELESQLILQRQQHNIQSTKSSIGSTVVKLLDSDSSAGSGTMEVYVILMCTLDFLDANTVADSLVLQFLDFSNKIEGICIAVRNNAIMISQNANELKSIIGNEILLV